MNIRSIALSAGVPYLISARQAFRLLYAPAPLTVTLFRETSPVGQATGVRGNLGLNGDFDAVSITSPTAQTVLYGAGTGLSRLEYSPQTTDIAGATIIDDAQVAVGVAATLLVPAATTRRSIRFYNYGADPVWLGSANVMTTGGLQLAPGQMWIETSGANAAWYGIATVAGQNIGIQEVLD